MNRRGGLLSKIGVTEPAKPDYRSLAATIVLVLLPCTGCTSVMGWASGGWVADYDTAEQRARESNRELLIFYKDTRPGVDDALEDALSTQSIAGRTRDYVRCQLFKPYEPDRRYVAQFGIQRAPALILVHHDGTYHARSGAMSTGEIMAFLAEAKPPGAQPAVDRLIPRRPQYNWLDTIERAEEVSTRTGRPALIVYYRSLTRDWPRLEKLLDRWEVYSRFSDMVHCRVGTSNPWTSAYITRFGALKLPAIVVVGIGGAHQVLEMPTTLEAIVRFADTALVTGEGADTEVYTGTVGSTATGGS